MEISSRSVVGSQSFRIGFACDWQGTAHSGSFFPLKNQIISQQQRANRDACIGDVEGWPMPGAGVHDNEINNVPKAGAVSQITGDSGEQERASPQNAIVVSRSAQKVIEHGHRGGDGKHHEEPPSKTSAFLQLTKSYPRILRVNKVEETANDGPIAREPQPA